MKVSIAPLFVPPPSQDWLLTMTLSAREAGVLLSVCGGIGGPPEGPRGMFDKLAESLQSIGVQTVDYSTREGEDRIYLPANWSLWEEK